MSSSRTDGSLGPTAGSAAAADEAAARDLPFLVTHWLNNFGSGDDDASRRIRSAASELASAFSTLGAYGTVTRSASSGNDLRPATYPDLARRYASLPPSQLQAVLASGASATAAVHALAERRSGGSALDAAAEGADSNAAADTSSVGSGALSVLRPPAMLTAPPRSAAEPGAPPESSPSEENSNPCEGGSLSASDLAGMAESVDAAADELRDGAGRGEALPPRHATVALKSDWAGANAEAGRASRAHVALRSRYRSEEREMTKTRAVIVDRNELRESVARQRSLADAIISGNGAAAAAAAAAAEATKMGGGGGAETEELDLRALESKDKDAERVIAQLERRLEQLEITHEKTKDQMDNASAKARMLRSECLVLRRKYGDSFALGSSSIALPSAGAVLPVSFAACGGPRSSSLLSNVIARPYCAGGTFRPGHRCPGRLPGPASLVLPRKQLLSQRLSHSVTASCHLFYPVYCLRFDRTGRYFVTGADDHLAKLFYLGAGISPSTSRGAPSAGRARFSYGANARGAVLVCSLRGHGGVITDIDVSADNAMLATASEDGDVRVWGMRDGAPVAILRGHAGGANMVSWSPLTPYRLVTTGQDGLAREWDVREAALKRYGGVIGKRVDYVQPKLCTMDGRLDGNSSSEEEDGNDDEDDDDGEDDLALPPLPMRQAEVGNGDVVANNAEAAPGANAIAAPRNGILVPPLPPGAEGLPIGGGNGVLPGAGNNANGNLLRDDAARGANNGNVLPQPGAFVPGDAVDEGVSLLSKLQHGEILQGNQLHGPSTRSQRKAVKVICLSRCPLGGHFVTGSDDGMGRIWAEEDDDRMIRQDFHFKNGLVKSDSTIKSDETGNARKRKSGRLKRQRNRGRGDIAPSRSTLLASLSGHLNSITDVQYSHAGDRILTASQKDGVVRIWSWGTEIAPVEHNPMDPSSPASKTKNRVKFDNIKQILIRLTTPADLSMSGGSSRTGPGRRRGGPSSGSPTVDVSCDVAVWSLDDSNIITSQTCLIKQGGSDIVPGSHVLYVWDSRSGRCLTGIPSAHNAPCPVLTCHPLEPTIVASAGGDGKVNVWDLDTGKRLFEHENRLLHGPVDPPTNRGKIAGFLDGCFSPDGMFLVLTDDAGRVTIVDTLLPAEEAEKARANAAVGTSLASPQGSESNPIPIEPNVYSGLSSSYDPPADVPHWMSEQYFGNDYYDLFYDNNGYCIERGSEQPPHLSPRAARCNHTGEACSDLICEAFAKMAGPQPLVEDEVRWRRDNIRKRSLEVRHSEGLLMQNVQGKRTATNSCSSGAESHAYESSFAGLLRKIGARAPAEPAAKIRETLTSLTASSGAVDISSQPVRALSSRYRWISYEDMRDDAVEIEEEDDDEEYQDAPRGRRLYADEEASNASDEMDDTDLSNVDLESTRVSRSSSRRSSGGRRLGGSGRRRHSSQRAESEAASPVARSQRQQRRGRNRARHVAFEEQQRNQPTRVSARQMTQSPSRQRRRYEVPDSDDEDVIEEMSTNKAPAGDHVEDYTVRGHLFKLPERGVVKRDWLRRTESESGMLGKKPYAPQVGDSVVYIPRAHKDTIQEFPTVDNSVAPWKSWPTSSAWPVVQCAVRDIRYRFPYDNYYRNRAGATSMSIVAILTLEVTGIPQIASDRTFPWPKPEFISRLSRSSHKTFELSVFDNDQPEFLIPEHLYTWKTNELERAIREQDDDASGLQLVSYFEPGEGNAGYGEEDPDLIPYKCTLSSVSAPEEDDNEMHFENSGYSVLDVIWEESEEVNAVSTWEVTLLDSTSKAPLPFQLHENEKAALFKILDTIEEDRKIRMHFSHPVNITRYTDYLNMIEVPMDLQFIRKRLRQDYYTNRLSLLSDVKLIRENCIKYNGEDDGLSLKACEMFDTAKEMIDELPEYPRQQQVVTQQQERGVSAGRGSAQRATSSPTEDDTSRQSPRRASSRLAHQNNTSAQSTPSQTPSAREGVNGASSTRQSQRATRADRGIASSLENLPSQGMNREGDQPSNTRRRIRLSLRAAAGVSTPEMARVSRATRSTRSSRMQDVSEDESDKEQVDSEGKRNAYSTPDEDESDTSEEEEDEPEEEMSRRNIPSRRSIGSPKSKRTTGLHDKSDSEESESEKEEDDHDRPTRRSARARRSPRKFCEDSSLDDEEGLVQQSSTPQTRRARRRGSGTLDEYAEDSAEDSPEDSPNRRSRKVVHYEDPGSSDFDSDDLSDDDGSGVQADEMSSSSDDEEFNQGRRSAKKRKVSSSKRKGASKKSKASCETAQEKYLYNPSLARWPPVVPRARITELSQRIMDLVSRKDTDNLFTRPVAEEYPDMADSYHSSVGTPMDFRTIREERLPLYKDMTELQDDLILTYKNCCTYNGEGNQFYSYAMDRWSNLNNIFKQACEEEGIPLPRRWG